MRIRLGRAVLPTLLPSAIGGTEHLATEELERAVDKARALLSGAADSDVGNLTSAAAGSCVSELAWRANSPPWMLRPDTLLVADGAWPPSQMLLRVRVLQATIVTLTGKSMPIPGAAIALSAADAGPGGWLHGALQAFASGGVISDPDEASVADGSPTTAEPLLRCSASRAEWIQDTQRIAHNATVVESFGCRWSEPADSDTPIMLSAPVLHSATDDPDGSLVVSFAISMTAPLRQVSAFEDAVAAGPARGSFSSHRISCALRSDVAVIVVPTVVARRLAIDSSTPSSTSGSLPHGVVTFPDAPALRWAAQWPLPDAWALFPVDDGSADFAGALEDTISGRHPLPWPCPEQIQAVNGSSYGTRPQLCAAGLDWFVQVKAIALPLMTVSDVAPTAITSGAVALLLSRNSLSSGPFPWLPLVPSAASAAATSVSPDGDGPLQVRFGSLLPPVAYSPDGLHLAILIPTADALCNNRSAGNDGAGTREPRAGILRRNTAPCKPILQLTRGESLFAAANLSAPQTAGGSSNGSHWHVRLHNTIAAAALQGSSATASSALLSQRQLQAVATLMPLLPANDARLVGALACPPVCTAAQFTQAALTSSQGSSLLIRGGKVENRSTSPRNDPALGLSGSYSLLAALLDGGGFAASSSGDQAVAALGDSSDGGAAALAAGGIIVIRQCAASNRRLPPGISTMSALCSNVTDARSSGDAGYCFYGEAADCVACPPGGVCPGGFRLWSRPGFYVPSEDSVDLPIPCLFPAAIRCVGWDVAAGTTRCGLGYRQGSPSCSVCASGFYADADTLGECRPCPTTDVSATIAAMQGIGIVVAGVLALAAILGGIAVLIVRRAGGTVRAALQRTATFALNAYLGMQLAVQVAVNAPPTAPPLVARTLAALRTLQLQGVAPTPLACTTSPPLLVPILLLSGMLFAFALWLAVYAAWTCDQQRRVRVQPSEPARRLDPNAASRNRSPSLRAAHDEPSAARAPAWAVSSRGEALGGGTSSGGGGHVGSSCVQAFATACAPLGRFLLVALVAAFALTTNTALDVLVCTAPLPMTLRNYQFLIGDGSTAAAQLGISATKARTTLDPTLLGTYVAVPVIAAKQGVVCGEDLHRVAQPLALATIALIVLAFPATAIVLVRCHAIPLVLRNARVPQEMLVRGLRHVCYGAAFTDALIAGLSGAAAGRADVLKTARPSLFRRLGALKKEKARFDGIELSVVTEWQVYNMLQRQVDARLLLVRAARTAATATRRGAKHGVSAAGQADSSAEAVLRAPTCVTWLCCQRYKLRRYVPPPKDALRMSSFQRAAVSVVYPTSLQLAGIPYGAVRPVGKVGQASSAATAAVAATMRMRAWQQRAPAVREAMLPVPYNGADEGIAKLNPLAADSLDATRAVLATAATAIGSPGRETAIRALADGSILNTSTDNDIDDADGAGEPAKRDLLETVAVVVPLCGCTCCCVRTYGRRTQTPEDVIDSSPQLRLRTPLLAPLTSGVEVRASAFWLIPCNLLLLALQGVARISPKLVSDNASWQATAAIGAGAAVFGGCCAMAALQLAVAPDPPRNSWRLPGRLHVLLLAGIGALYTALANANTTLALGTASDATAAAQSAGTAAGGASVGQAMTLSTTLGYVVAVLCIGLLPNLAASFIGSLIVLGREEREQRGVQSKARVQAAVAARVEVAAAEKAEVEAVEKSTAAAAAAAAAAAVSAVNSARKASQLLRGRPIARISRRGSLASSSSSSSSSESDHDVSAAALASDGSRRRRIWRKSAAAAVLFAGGKDGGDDLPAAGAPTQARTRLSVHSRL